MKNFFKGIFGTSDENEGFVDYEEDGYDASSSAVTEEEAYDNTYNAFPAPKAAINLHTNPHSRITVMMPTDCDEVMSEGIERLREGTIIFLNLTKIDKEKGTRIVDFLTGAAAMCDGRIEKLGDNTCCYAVAPKNVEWVNVIDD